MGTIKTTNIEPIADNGTVTLGSSGDQFTLATGAKSSFLYPAFRAYGSTSQAIPNNTFTKVEIDTETFDTDGNYDITNYRFTPQTAGKYFFTTTIRMTAISAINNYQVFLYKNGSLNSRFANGGTHAANPSNSVSDILTMNGSTDYVEVFVYQSYGSDRNIFNGTANTYFSGYRIGS